MFCLFYKLKTAIFVEISGNFGLLITKPFFQSGFSALSSLSISWIPPLFIQGKSFNFKVHFFKKTSVGPQYHNENRFSKISMVRFKRIYECILRLTSLTLIRKVCLLSYEKKLSTLEFLFSWQNRIFLLTEKQRTLLRSQCSQLQLFSLFFSAAP